jgi:hypothetical protein
VRPVPSEAMSGRFVTLALAICAGALGSFGVPSDHGTASTTGAPATPNACERQGTHTIAADRKARVFSRRGIVYGCALRTGKQYRLGQLASCIGSDRAGPLALAGELVGYGSERCGIDTGISQVIVRNLADGKQQRAEAALTGALGPESYVSVGSLVLNADGAVAWIATGGSILARSRTHEVHRADATGRAVLDLGTPIDPSSLRLHGLRLTWKRGHATRSAELR